MPKPFLSYDQQIEKLRDEKGLRIDDEIFAIENLKRISYFALIGGYKDLFKDSATSKYRAGTAFEDVVELYKFDERLREIILKYLLQVERNMRSLISYYFCELHGEDQSAYLDVQNYRYAEHQVLVESLVGKLKELATDNNSQYRYIRHHIKHHSNVPLWVLSCTLTFGTVSKIYSLLPQSLQATISKNYLGIRENHLQKMLSVLSKYRNVCAHNERLFSYTTKDSIPDLSVHNQLGISKNKGLVAMLLPRATIVEPRRSKSS